MEPASQARCKHKKKPRQGWQDQVPGQILQTTIRG